MKTTLILAYLALVGNVASSFADNNYDSRIDPPHTFSWSDTNVYNYVDFWDSAHASINGGVLYSVTLNDSSTGTVTDGHIDGLRAEDDSSLLVLGVNCDHISAWQRGKIDLYGCQQSRWGQVFAVDDAVIRIFGGNYNWVLSMADGNGGVEVSGNTFVKTLSSTSRGIIIQKGGQTERFDAVGTGVAVLDDGMVNTVMTGAESSTLVVAGGYPPPDIRLFDNARLIVLHTDDARPEIVSYKLADLVEEGASPNFSGKNLAMDLDGFYLEFLVSAWTNSAFLSGKWNGRIDVVKIIDGIRLFPLDGDSVMIAFRAPGNEVVQMEVSKDLVSWEPLKSAFPSDWNVHVEIVRKSADHAMFFRLRKWRIPGT